MLEVNMILKLGKNPLCLKIIVYSLQAKNTITKTNKINAKTIDTIY